MHSSCVDITIGVYCPAREINYKRNYELDLERLHRSTVTVTITIKSGSHKGMNQYFMVTVEKVSPTGATITITFMVMAIKLGSLWRDFT
jgi:Ni,Fe-hydrogenase III large subunit